VKSGSLYQSAACERFRQPPVARKLLPENVVQGDARRRPARIHDFYAFEILADEDRGPHPVIAMADGVENGFPDGAFIERLDVPNEQAVLIMLVGISQVDGFPQPVVKREKPLPEIDPLLGGTGRVAGPVFKDDFSLSQIPPQGLTGSKKYQGGIGDFPTGGQLRVSQQLFG
jgi:hypothetical protein